MATIYDTHEVPGFELSQAIRLAPFDDRVAILETVGVVTRFAILERVVKCNRVTDRATRTQWFAGDFVNFVTRLAILERLVKSNRVAGAGLAGWPHMRSGADGHANTFRVTHCSDFLPNQNIAAAGAPDWNHPASR